MKVNEIYEGKIIDDNLNGNGILKINNFPIFIPFTLKDDYVKVKIVKLNKKYAFGEVLENNNTLKKLPCPHFYKCGGCNLFHISYERENFLKENYIKRLFKDIPTTYTCLERYNYRNKVTFHVTNEKIGFYKENTNSLIEINNCLLLKEEINKFLKELKKINLKNIKELTIKEGDNESLLLNIKGNISIKDLESLKKYPKLKTIYVNDKLVYGSGYIKITLDNKEYLINALAFFQVNTKGAEALYRKIKEYLKGFDKVLDLYCGIGSIGIFASDVVKKIIGIEINKEAVLCAREVIKLNNIKNYEIHQGDASTIKDSFDVVIVDPPRSGLSDKVIANLQNMASKKIIYVSCNPSTLKRDILKLNNYKLEKIDIFNMFPLTKHIECICLLKKI